MYCYKTALLYETIDIIVGELLYKSGDLCDAQYHIQRAVYLQNKPYIYLVLALLSQALGLYGSIGLLLCVSMSQQNADDPADDSNRNIDPTETAHRKHAMNQDIETQLNRNRPSLHPQERMKPTFQPTDTPSKMVADKERIHIFGLSFIVAKAIGHDTQRNGTSNKSTKQNALSSHTQSTIHTRRTLLAGYMACARMDIDTMLTTLITRRNNALDNTTPTGIVQQNTEEDPLSETDIHPMNAPLSTAHSNTIPATMPSPNKRNRDTLNQRQTESTRIYTQSLTKQMQQTTTISRTIERKETPSSGDQQDQNHTKYHNNNMTYSNSIYILHDDLAFYIFVCYLTVNYFS
eukprot:971222_1